MTIGEKIRAARLERSMTQAEIAGDKITRNMLSSIESGKALPSLDTLFHISKMLNLPIAYLLSEEADLSTYKRNEMIASVREAFSNKRYAECIEMVNNVGSIDDELGYILTCAHFEIGVTAAKIGSFITAQKHLSLADEYSSKTVYDTKRIECRIPLYLSFVNNVNSPLLDFDEKNFYDTMVETVDFEFFKYLCNDVEYPYQNQLFRKHAAAKTMIKERKYYDAIEILLEIAESKSAYEYNSYLIYSVYGDLDNCYKQICDFENAYKYSVKRLSLLEGFNS